jgi:hypothetical protein
LKYKKLSFPDLTPYVHKSPITQRVATLREVKDASPGGKGTADSLTLGDVYYNDIQIFGKSEVRINY